MNPETDSDHRRLADCCVGSGRRDLSVFALQEGWRLEKRVQSGRARADASGGKARDQRAHGGQNEIGGDLLQIRDWFACRALRVCSPTICCHVLDQIHQVCDGGPLKRSVYRRTIFRENLPPFRPSLRIVVVSRLSHEAPPKNSPGLG